jgi:Eukaryotic cytochrome b561
MLDWLQLPLDITRAHQVDVAAAWHGRLMVLAWSVLLPLGILIARFFKITPRQNWPAELDNKLWWRSHLTLQYAGGLLMLLALALIWQSAGFSGLSLHTSLGWVVVASAFGQFLSGWLRGTKGGPTAPAADGSLKGDHYDMTRRRKVFEAVHKTVGYTGLVLSMAAIGSGFWLVNAPRWMPLVWGAWCLVLSVVWIALQRRGFAIDTYQAIWGPDQQHPGNRLATNWGARRRTANEGGDKP